MSGGLIPCVTRGLCLSPQRSSSRWGGLHLADFLEKQLADAHVADTRRKLPNPHMHQLTATVHSVRMTHEAVRPV